MVHRLTLIPDVDPVAVRENTEDIYAVEVAVP